jgi:hypothetical protein
MNWGKGLRRLWVVATAVWILSVVAVLPEIATEGVSAAEGYAEYWYYHIIRSDVAAEARRLGGDHQKEISLPCVSNREREQQEAEVAQLEAEEAKRPPPPPLPDGTKRGTRSQLARLMLSPECSAKEIELRGVVYDPPDWEPLLSLTYWLFGPPIAALVVGTSLIWAFRGFRAV